MNTQRQREALRWKQKPIPELVRLAWPIAVSMLSYSIMTLVSTLFVGRLGANALAGVGLGGIAAFGLIVFGFGLLRAVKVVVSQATGAGRSSELSVYIATGVLLALALGLVSVTTGRWLAAVLPRFAGSPETGVFAADYLWWRNLGAPFVLVAVVLREARYGLSDSRSPLVSALAANVTNVALDTLFILGLGLGVRGAGAATALSHVVEAAFLIGASRHPGFAFARIRFRHVRALFKLGVPLGLQFVLEVGAFAVLVAVLAQVGAVDLAAHQIALQVTHLSFLPALAVGEAASVLVGQAVGAGEDGLVKIVARRALLVTSVYTGLCALAFVGLAHVIAGVFTTDLAVRAMTVKLLWVAAAFQVFDGGNAVARSVLRGTGDVRYPAVIAVLIAWVSTPPLAWWLGIHLGWGAVGGWLGLAAEIVVGSSLLWWRLERGGWRKSAAASRERLASEPEASELAGVAVTP
ncbi:MAG: MATE family efflux transporter [Myxococcales bacterium]|nr:MATE family efflux transporter [Myxococcales bacterium]